MTYFGREPFVQLVGGRNHPWIFQPETTPTSVVRKPRRLCSHRNRVQLVRNAVAQHNVWDALGGQAAPEFHKPQDMGQTAGCKY
ncbi:hypothetical protein INR49_001011 [Caranx melampygus]|nr:hypothetical protein INR49_001011 [Caranx melampygus]